MKYDIIIVGGGIAGLRMGLHLLRSYPDMRCCILERANYFGGRIYTYKTTIKTVGPIQWESGAGRISTDHYKTLGLLKEYGLTFIPIPSNMDFMTGPYDRRPNPFEKWIEIYLKPLMALPQDTLRAHTLEQLLEQVIGKEKTRIFFEMFPYYAETRIMRADVALHSFTHEMASNEGFGICKEGFASVTHHMAQDFVRLGGILKKGVEIQSIQGKIVSSVKRSWEARYAVVCAITSEAAKKIKGVKEAPFLSHLTMIPLMRIYAVFPTPAWFIGLPKIVTNHRVRYILPMNPDKGTIMISYTEGVDADKWRTESRKKDVVERELMGEIRALFPEYEIPDPLFFSIHRWGHGCTYWLPGQYDVIEESRASIQPFPDTNPALFLCGESFAPSTCWVESALTQTDLAFEGLRRQLLFNE